MSRQIKFRAWDEDKKVMLHTGEDFYTIPVADQPLSTKDGGMAINFELSQWTGLQDKNGQDI